VLQSKVVVLSAKEKAERISQVCTMKLNESEESNKRRYYKNTVKTRKFKCCWDKYGRNLITVRMAVGVEATGAWYRLL
jgi:hypothetical protein